MNWRLNICQDCIHSRVCRFKEEYKKFLDEPAKEAFDSMPDFLDMHVTCKHRSTGVLVKNSFKEIS